MSEADRLKEDVQRMLAGLPPRGQQQTEDQTEEDLDDVISESKGEIADVIRNVIDQTITSDAIKKICEEKGLTARLGQFGVGRIAAQLKNELTDAMENNFPEDR
jgi:hypothetical protein